MHIQAVPRGLSGLKDSEKLKGKVVVGDGEKLEGREKKGRFDENAQYA